MSVKELLLHIAIDILMVMVLSIGIGASAPRWSANWLQGDFGPLRFTRFDTRAGYRRIGITKLTRALPELGSVFGGKSKRELPGLTAADLNSYLVDVRRAEWVHWLSMLTWVPLAFFNPWWLTLAFAMIVVIGNWIFVLVLRHNRLRLTGILERRRI